MMCSGLAGEQGLQKRSEGRGEVLELSVPVLNFLRLSEAHSQDWLCHWAFSSICIMR
jgi:hypothetical protein